MTISRSAIAYFVKANAKDEDPPVVGDGMNCPGDGPGFCPQCSDGIDNDGDGPPDFEGGDEQCVSPEDDSEGAGPNCPTAGPGVCPQCYDGEDNADPEDKIKDYPNDPGCFNRADNNETDPIATGNCPKDGPGLCPACNDGIDNEGDGYVDWSGWDSDKDGINDILRDPSCQGEPDKNSESGAFEEIEK
jgi:hypothetical protein